MPEVKWEVIYEVAGAIQAEIIRGLLEAQEISVWLSQESAGREAYSAGVGLLGRVQVLVPTYQIERAKEVLDAYYSGEFEEMEFEPNAAQEIEEQARNEHKEEDRQDDEITGVQNLGTI
jgi:hypothetical protein